jgi:hypothetical protein
MQKQYWTPAPGPRQLADGKCGNKQPSQQVLALIAGWCFAISVSIAGFSATTGCPAPCRCHADSPSQMQLISATPCAESCTCSVQCASSSPLYLGRCVLGSQTTSNGQHAMSSCTCNAPESHRHSWHLHAAESGDFRWAHLHVPNQ